MVSPMFTWIDIPFDIAFICDSIIYDPSSATACLPHISRSEILAHNHMRSFCQMRMVVKPLHDPTTVRIQSDD
jgi:hypothetical protein